MNEMNTLTWKCDVCGKTRPDGLISVLTKDLSRDYGMPPGTFKYNIKYCNDNPSCIEGAKTKTLKEKK